MNWENYRPVYRYESYSDGEELHGRFACDVSELARLKDGEPYYFDDSFKGKWNTEHYLLEKIN